MAWGKGIPCLKRSTEITAILCSDPVQAVRIADEAELSLSLSSGLWSVVVSAPQFFSKESCGLLCHTLAGIL